MNRRLQSLGAALALLAAAPVLAAPAEPERPPGYIHASPSLGKAEGQCRPNERGPAVMITILGFKDRAGLVRAEIYPSNDSDFLQDDNILVMAGKTFRRVEMPTPPSGPVQLCIRVPAAGTYSLIVLHDRDSNRKFGLSSDGAGFPGDPKVCLGQPKAAQTALRAGAGITDITLRLQYRRNLFCLGPLKN